MSFDQTFIDTMVHHHEGAIAMGRVAQERGEHPEVKKMGGDIISAQEGEITTMKGWRKAWFGSDTIPPMAAGKPGMADMPGMANMMGMAGDIEGLKTANPFDLAFWTR